VPPIGPSSELTHAGRPYELTLLVSTVLVDCCLRARVSACACVRVSQMASAAFNGSPMPVNGTAVVRLQSLATDMAVVGRHVVGDVSAEIETEPDVSVQIQWTTSVGDGPRYDVPIVGQYIRVRIYGVNVAATDQTD